MYLSADARKALFLRWAGRYCTCTVITRTANRTMETVNRGVQPICSSPAGRQGKSPAKGVLQSFFHLLTGTVITFALATLTLFGMNAGLDVAATGTRTAVSVQRYADLPAFADKLAAACWQGPKAMLLASPAANCAFLAAQAAQHLSGASVPAGMMDRLAGRLVTMVARQLQAGAVRIAMNWLSNRCHAAAIQLH